MCNARYALVMVLSLFACAVRADEVADEVVLVSPMIGETTALVIRLDPAGLSAPDLVQALKSTEPGGEQAMQAWRQSAEAGIRTLRELTAGQPVYATVGIPVSKEKWETLVFLRLTPQADRKALAERLDAAMVKVPWTVRGDVAVAAPTAGGEVGPLLDALVPSPRAGLDAAFRSVHAYPVQILLLPPEYVRRTLVELMPELPRQLGGGPSAVLTEGLVWAALGLDPAKLQAELVVQSASDAAAGRLAQRLPAMLQSFYDSMPELQAQIARPTFQSLLTLLRPEAKGDRIVLRLNGLESTGESVRLVAVIAAALHDRVRREENADQFKQILLAMHNYHDRHGVFPPRAEARDAEGKPRLSWRVHILPFVDQQKLYDEFHLDEPWDSPHNKVLLPKMPPVYQGQTLAVPPGYTTFQAPAGEDTVLGGPKPVNFGKITDGTSNTVVLVEVKPELAVPWTAPQDYAFDPANPAGGLQIGADSRLLSGFADGSVHQLRGDAPPKQLLRLFEKSDGEPVDYDAVQ